MYGGDRVFEYVDALQQLLSTVFSQQEEVIKELALVFKDNLMSDGIIHVFGSGHSHLVGIEMFARAGGLGNVNAILDADVLTSSGARRGGAVEKLSGLADIIYDNYKIDKHDLMIIVSNSGRNALPIEMAMRCEKEGVKTVAITNLAHSKSCVSRHHSGKRLFESVDYVVDTFVPIGDGLVMIDGMLTGAASSIISMALVHTITTEAIKLCVAEGFRPMVFQSQNLDGFDNDQIYKKYEDKIKFY